MTGISVLYGDLRTGRIFGEIDATGANWAQVLNDAGSVDQVVVPDDVIRALDLRRTAACARSFLAVEIDTRMQQAGPIWSRPYDWERGQVTLGAAGLWSLFDYRRVIPVLLAGQRPGDVTTTLTGADLGEIARRLVAQAMSWVGGGLPLVLPDPRPGTMHTETWPGWQLAILAGELTKLTQRVGGPDIRFVPRRRADDRRFIEWVMETGTDVTPQLSQVGADWVFDTTARRGPVLGIGTDENGTQRTVRGWILGNGQEEATRFGMAEDSTFVDEGGPLLEQEDSHTDESDLSILDGYATDMVSRTARPVEVWKVSVIASAARDVQAGDYCRVKTKDHPWLGTGSTRMRVQKKSGDLTDKVVLDMFPLQAAA